VLQQQVHYIAVSTACLVRWDTRLSYCKLKTTHCVSVYVCLIVLGDGVLHQAGRRATVELAEMQQRVAAAEAAHGSALAERDTAAAAVAAAKQQAAQAKADAARAAAEVAAVKEAAAAQGRDVKQQLAAKDR
jgi:chorismate mutase